MWLCDPIRFYSHYYCWIYLPPNLNDDSSTDESELFWGGFEDGATRALAGAGRLVFPLAADEAADE